MSAVDWGQDGRVWRGSAFASAEGFNQALSFHGADGLQAGLREHMEGSEPGYGLALGQNLGLFQERGPCGLREAVLKPPEFFIVAMCKQARESLRLMDKAKAAEEAAAELLPCSHCQATCEATDETPGRPCAGLKEGVGGLVYHMPCTSNGGQPHPNVHQQCFLHACRQGAVFAPLHAL